MRSRIIHHPAGSGHSPNNREEALQQLPSHRFVEDRKSGEPKGRHPVQKTWPSTRPQDEAGDKPADHTWIQRYAFMILSRREKACASTR